MKKFITNYWKKILICIGAIFIIMNIFTKITTEKTLLSDYIKYGKDIEQPEIIESVTDQVITTEAPVTPELMQMILIVGGIILLIVIITSLAERAGASSKSSKK